ncbi:putative Tetratricopeptide repeat protein [Gammaproteobacteria bacterium]
MSVPHPNNEELRIILYGLATPGEENRFVAETRLEYFSGDFAAPKMVSPRFRFTFPVLPITPENIDWCLGRYWQWPSGRSEPLDRILPYWGQALYRVLLGCAAARPTCEVWRYSEGQKYLSIQVETPPLGPVAVREQVTVARLYGLPWETIHDGYEYLCRDSLAIRRKVPEGRTHLLSTDPPIHALLISPRPEIPELKQIFDPRAAAQALFRATESGIEPALLVPPTFEELEKTLIRARRKKTPYSVVHWDGYAATIKKKQVGLHFEDPSGLDRLENRSSTIISVEDFAKVLCEHRVQLVFLTITVETQLLEDILKTEIATVLIQAGISAVVTLHHRFPKHLLTHFLSTFYERLAQGTEIGVAIAQSRQSLWILASPIENQFSLIDWFSPMLYQGHSDFCPFYHPSEGKPLTQTRLSCENTALPEPPIHGFQGRIREVLALERCLLNTSYAVLSGIDGIGKSTLAVETARWLVESRRFDRAVFVSLEEYSHPQAFLECIYRQLAQDQVAIDIRLQSWVEKALAKTPTIVVLDDISFRLRKIASLQPILELCKALQRAAITTRLIFVSHKELPHPYAGHVYLLGALDDESAVALIAAQLRATGKIPLPSDPGRNSTELFHLVQSLDKHPRALLLAASELSTHGVRATTRMIRTLLGNARSQDKQTGLDAALALALRRLPLKLQKRIPVLAHFQGMANWTVLSKVLDLSPTEVSDLIAFLISIGLAKDLGEECLALDQGLLDYLSTMAKQETRDLWGKAMTDRLAVLYKEWFGNALLGLHLTHREVYNLLVLLDWSLEHHPAEETLGLVWRLETLLAPLRLSKALERVSTLREKLSPRVGGWGRAAFAAESEAVERLLAAGWLPEAQGQAQTLLKRAEAAGERAYPGANYDLAMAHRLVGRVLEATGTTALALAHLEKAWSLFQILVAVGTFSASASRMASVCRVERGDCLRSLERWDEAISAYQESFVLDEMRGATRDAAINQFKIADVHRLQGKFLESLTLYEIARETFAELKDPSMVADAWYQIGRIQRELNNAEAAELAYQKVLEIWVRRGDRRGEALALFDLADLYQSLGRLEQAEKAARQSVDRYALLEEKLQEGRARRRLTEILKDLGDLALARTEALRAIACHAPDPKSAESWKTWACLIEIERQVGQEEASTHAWNEAVSEYLSYRREEDEPSSQEGILCEQVAKAVARGFTSEEMLSPTLEVSSAFFLRIRSILTGERDPALANDSSLSYKDAAELRLLLERIAEF